MSQNQNTPEKALNEFLELISIVGDRATKKVLERHNLSSKMQDPSALLKELDSELENTMIESLIEGGKAQTREQAIKMLDEAI